MTPIFGRKKEPTEVFDENMKKAKNLYESPKLWKSSEYKKLLKHIEKAQEIAETVEVDQEDIVRLWSMKGSVFWMGYHRLEEALECYDKALSVNPRDWGSSFNRLQLLKSMGKWDEVVKDCDKVLELIPEIRGEKITTIPGSPGFETWDQLESMLWAQKGEALSHLTKVSEAVRCYDKSLKLNPSYVRAWTYMAICYLNLEKWHEAIDSCDKAIELEPKNIFAWHNKGVALSQLERYEEALRCYDRALEIDPKDLESLNNKGLALYYLGRYEEALECINKSLEYGPKRYHADVRTLLNKVRVLGTLAGKDLYDLSKQRSEEWYQKERKVEKMHKEIEMCLAHAVHLNPQEFLVNIAKVDKDWESRGGLKAQPRRCSDCHAPKAIGDVVVWPLYLRVRVRGARKKRKGWGLFIGAICPHAKRKLGSDSASGRMTKETEELLEKIAQWYKF